MAILSGTTAAFAFAGQTLPTTECAGWQAEMGYRMRNITPIGYVSERWLGTLIYARGEVAFFKDSTAATVPIPSGANGALTLTEASGASHAFPAVLTLLGISANGPEGAPQIARYGFVLSATTSTSTVTVT